MTQLVQASPNFAFLLQPSLLLGGDLAAAELYVHTDPDAAMGKARRFSETLAERLLVSAGLTARRNQSDRTINLLAAGVIDAHLKGLFDKIRMAGNKAVHSHSGDAKLAIEVLEACFELSAWWHQRETGTAVAHTFTAPVRPPTQTEEFLVLIQNVEAQLTSMQLALEAGFAATVAPPPPARITIGAGAPDRHAWRGGSEVVCGGTPYLVHDPVDSVPAADGSWTMLQADAHAWDSTARPVRLRAIRTDHPGRSADELTGGLRAQGDFLRARQHARTVPTFVAHQHAGRLQTLVTATPPAVTWQARFGDGSAPLDALVLPAVLDILATVADGLAELHRAGQAHRALSGMSVLVDKSGRHGLLRDLGWAWWPRLPGVIQDYGAPEQQATARGRPGPATDVFQLAALLQHTCTGVRPGTGRAVPLQVFLPGVPATLDELMERSLDPDPRLRPSMAALAAGVRHGRRQLRMEATA